MTFRQDNLEFVRKQIIADVCSHTSWLDLIEYDK